METGFGVSMPQAYSKNYFAKYMALKFAKMLPTLGIHDKAIPDPEPTILKGLLHITYYQQVSTLSCTQRICYNFDGCPAKFKAAYI